MSKLICVVSGVVMMFGTLAMELHENEATIVCAISGTICVMCLFHEYLEAKRHENDVRLSWRYNKEGVWE